MTCRQPELGATVADQIEFGVAAAAKKLVLAGLVGPAFVHMLFGNRDISIKERSRCVLIEVKVSRSVASAAVAMANAANAPGTGWSTKSDISETARSSP